MTPEPDPRVFKVCIVGDFAVGKTSTVARWVKNEFSEKYLTTVGVKIDTKIVDCPDRGPVKLVIWDIAGTDRFEEIEIAYLRGSDGLIFVADGTRGDTVDAALRLRHDIESRYGPVPFVALLNKSDLSDLWEIGDDSMGRSSAAGVEWIHCSAKTGDNVERALNSLAEHLADEL